MNDKLDCRFCHVYATKSTSVEIPSVAKCMMCHRVIATGRGSHHPEGERFAVGTHGRNGMPPFRSDLTAKDRWLVIAYLKTLK